MLYIGSLDFRNSVIASLTIARFKKKRLHAEKFQENLNHKYETYTDDHELIKNPLQLMNLMAMIFRIQIKQYYNIDVLFC